MLTRSLFSFILSFSMANETELKIGRGSRVSTWRIDPFPFDGEGQLIQSLQTVLPDVLTECHPFLKRAEVEVKFPDDVGDLFFETDGRYSNIGKAFFNEEEGQPLHLEIIISRIELFRNQHKDPRTAPNISALGTILHELFDADRNIKAREMRQRLDIPRDPRGHIDSEWEKISNERALRAVERIYGPHYKFEHGDVLTLR